MNHIQDDFAVEELFMTNENDPFAGYLLLKSQEIQRKNMGMRSWEYPQSKS